jgi:uncharacterized membrane protein
MEDADSEIQMTMRPDRFHQLFEIGVSLKGLHAVVELILGTVILTISPVAVSNLMVRLAAEQESRGSAAFTVNFLLDLARAVQHGGQHFAGIYLLVAGLINMTLVIGLLTGALWSYPAALSALAVFMAYQIYRYTHTHALALIVFFVFDAVVWYLIWHEYRFLRSGAVMERRSSYSHGD